MTKNEKRRFKYAFRIPVFKDGVQLNLEEASEYLNRQVKENLYNSEYSARIFPPQEFFDNNRTFMFFTNGKNPLLVFKQWGEVIEYVANHKIRPQGFADSLFYNEKEKCSEFQCIRENNGVLCMVVKTLSRGEDALNDGISKYNAVMKRLQMKGYLKRTNIAG